MHEVLRSQFYEYKRPLQEFGLEGLVDNLPILAFHPNQLLEETKSRIIKLSLEHSAFRQHRITDQLALEGINVCNHCSQSLVKREPGDEI